MYATNNGSTNKAPNSNATSMFDNTITVTPIKMELGDALAKSGSTATTPALRRPNAVIVTSQQLTVPMQTGLSVTNSGGGGGGGNAAYTTGMSVTSTTMTTTAPKEKPTKASRVQAVRKPPPTIENFWPNILSEVNGIGQVDAKHQVLPLARIKKIMKLDENAKMIAGEAPLLFAKACEYFIQELTMRAWVHTEESRRRTLQRSDIAQAIANYDQFDFLIDIVPREEIKPSTTQKTKEPTSSNVSAAAAVAAAAAAAAATAVASNNNPNASFTTGNVVSGANVPVATAAAASGLKLDATAAEVLGFSTVNPDLFAAAAASSNQQLQQLTTQQHQPQQVQIIQQGAGAQQLQYFIALPGQQPTQLVQQLHQQQQQQQQQNSLGLNIVAQQPTQQLILTAGPNGQLTATPAPTTAAQQQTALLQNLAQQQQQHQQQQQQQQQIQLLQQVVTPTGELTNVPIAINANQLHLLRLQMQQQQQQQQQQQVAAVQAAAAAAVQHNQQQQVIIPTQLLTAQQILQLGGTPTNATTVTQQQL
ncbi:nuclear transcription factor Y subunit gamma, partial [Drosophila novamexicana]|uniref:nuclear transcription factor Y subunit gamma n=1 Tax=Drosophila novamexicana TaxID=47314 RepID=UPI0011E5AE0F